ncbi:peroxisome biogenesis factor 10-like [Amphiura filiformis]|uniref:peroxisome biogenesis factor 10-like n=1 Tax=Amphiura filiformis TaxID=82378 RepID=UPI003B21EB5C
MFQPAGQAEILRSNQKDQYYVGYLQRSLADILQGVAGARAWMKWRKELDVLANFLYFGLTTVSGYQTLGEEYVNIVQVDPTQRAVPSVSRRLALVALHVSTPYLLDRAIHKLQKFIESSPRAAGIPHETRQRLLQWLPGLRYIVMFVHRSHLAVFYVSGLFYHLAKRFTGIRYLMVRMGLSSGSTQPSFHLLGWLLLIQLGLGVLHVLNQLRKNQLGERRTSVVASDTGSSEPCDSSLRCSLCLERRKNTTATPCGHLYCWQCIMDWCSTKPECPLCRDKFQISRLICLQNYDSHER